MIVSNVKIRIDNSDGSYSELENILPYEIAEELLCLYIDWKDKWMTTTKNTEEFLESEKEFNKKQ